METTENKRQIMAMDYDGSLIHDRFAYTYFRDKYIFTGNIISFRGKMDVSDNLIDREDLLNKDFIYSDDAINFCWELPGVDSFGGVAFQRYFATYVGNILGSIIQTRITVNGDDILVPTEEENKFKKASVSISTNKNGAVLGHLGINISAGDRAPNFAYSTKMTDEQLLDFVTQVETLFYNITRSMHIATTKTVG